MPNSIELTKEHISILDEIYRSESVTNDLIGDQSIVRAGVNANEICYPQISVQGLGDYDRNSGYTGNSVSLVWQTAKFNYDRGTKISVDAMDNQETFDIAFGRVSRELMRSQIAPEADAFTFATLAGIEGISKAKPVTYSDVARFLDDLVIAKNTMDEDEVPEGDRILYATPTLLNSLLALDTYKSKEIINSFSTVKKVFIYYDRFFPFSNLSGKIKKLRSGERSHSLQEYSILNGERFVAKIN